MSAYLVDRAQTRLEPVRTRAGHRRVRARDAGRGRGRRPRARVGHQEPHDLAPVRHGDRQARSVTPAGPCAGAGSRAPIPARRPSSSRSCSRYSCCSCSRWCRPRSSRDEVLVQDAARAAVREASVGASPERIRDAARRTLGGVEVEVHRTGGVGDPVEVRVHYRDHTNLPLVGPLFPDVTLHATGHDAGRSDDVNRARARQRQHPGAGRRRARARVVPRSGDVGGAVGAPSRVPTPRPTRPRSRAPTLALGRGPSACDRRRDRRPPRTARVSCRARAWAASRRWW